MYNRHNPSPRYRELIGLYGRMHREGEKFLDVPAEKTFPGTSLLREAAPIKALVARTHSATLLDYGSGKGAQYRARRITLDGGEWECVADYWDVDYVRCYDPAYPPYQEFPSGSFDGVICTDVLEHCPEDDVDWIVEEMLGFAKKFLYASVAGYPALKRLPTGENAHCTVKPLQWWDRIFQKKAVSVPGLLWQVRYYGAGPEGQTTVETIGRFE